MSSSSSAALRRMLVMPVVFAVWLPFQCLAGDEKALESMVQDVLAVDDVMDEKDLKKLQDLVKLGDEAYPAIINILEETRDPVIASRAFMIFIESEGDKTPAIKAVKRVLDRSAGPEKQAVKMRVEAINALGAIGTSRDCEAIYPYLDDENERVRINAMRATGRLGGPEAIERIEAVLERRTRGLAEEEARQDYSIREGHEAIEVIRARLSQEAPRGR